MTKKKYSLRSMLLMLPSFLLIATACSRPSTDEYYQPPLNPDGTEIVNPGEVIVKLPPISGMPEVLPQGSVTTVELTNENGITYHITGEQATDLEAGAYGVLINTVVPDNGSQGSGVSVLPQGTSINSEAITLPVAKDYQVPNLPQLFAGVGMHTVAPNATTDIAVQRHPMTRAIVVNASLKGSAATGVKSVSASLYGVMAKRNIANSFATRSAIADSKTSVDVNTHAKDTLYYINAQATSINAGAWSATLRLLGTDTHTKQILQITCRFDNDGTAPYAFETDVTGLLKAFNQGSAYQPAQLNATIDFKNAGVSGSIDGWTPGADEDINGQQKQN